MHREILERRAAGCRVEIPLDKAMQPREVNFGEAKWTIGIVKYDDTLSPTKS